MDISLENNRVGEPAPRILTKKEICVRVGISLTSPRKSKHLRRLVFTDKILQDINLTIEEYNRRKDFTLAESNILRSLLQL